MKFTELQPTPNNLLDTYVKDAVGRSRDITLFSRFINTHEGSCSIALDSPWGGGKTFFVKQTKMVLDLYNQHIISPLDPDTKSCLENNVEKFLPKDAAEMEMKPMVSVYYDAWANDNDADPVLSLVFEIIRSVNSDFSLKSTPDLFTLSAAVIDCFTGRNTSQILEVLRGENPMDSISKQRDLHNLINEFFDTVLHERGDRLVIFIDELDRCKPSYAVGLLERIKHYFSNDKVTFVFSINSDALQHTIRKFYGNQFEATKYIDRFFDLTMELPAIDTRKFYSYLGINNSSLIADEARQFLVKKYGLSMREAIRYYNLTDMILDKSLQQNSRALDTSLSVVLPVAALLKIHNLDAYREFIAGRNGTPFFEMMEENEYFNLHSVFLAQNEIFAEAQIDQMKVDMKDKLKEMYNALFVTRYDNHYYRHVIGTMRFDEKVRDEFLRILGAMSPKVDYGF